MRGQRNSVPYLASLSLIVAILACVWVVYFVLAPASGQTSGRIVGHLMVLSRRLQVAEQSAEVARELAQITADTPAPAIAAMHLRGQRQLEACQRLLADSGNDYRSFAPLPLSAAALDKAANLLSDAMVAAPTEPVTAGVAAAAGALETEKNKTGVSSAASQALAQRADKVEAECRSVAAQAEAGALETSGAVADVLFGLPTRLWLALLATALSVMGIGLTLVALLRGNESPIRALERQLDRAARKNPRVARDTAFQSIAHLLEVADQIARRSAG